MGTEMATNLIEESPSTVPVGFWHRLSDGRIQCDLCPRFCRLREGQRGMCFVRGRLNDEMVLTTYGRSSGFCIDPCREKAPQSFSAGHPGSLLWDSGLQSVLQVLPELGYQQVP